MIPARSMSQVIASSMSAPDASPPAIPTRAGDDGHASWRLVSSTSTHVATGVRGRLRCRLHAPIILLSDVNRAFARGASGHRCGSTMSSCCSGCTTVMELEEDVEALALFVERVRSAAPWRDGRRCRPRLHGAGRVRFDARANAAQLERARGFAERWHGRADDDHRHSGAEHDDSSSREQLR